MNTRVKHLLDDAMQLDPDDRVELAGRLLTSLEPSDLGVEDAWRAEIQKRILDIDSGSVTLMDAKEARQRIFRLPNADADV